jgi:multiple sugar transport system ATP-binding protein
MSALRVAGVRVSFGKAEILRGVELDVAAGETLVLFGPSGSGKTTLLRAIAGVEPAATGVVAIDGDDVSALAPEARNVGMAFQNFALYPHMPAFENIASPLRAKHVPQNELQRRVETVARMLRIDHVLSHAPRELSNGQKQRTSLARALVAEPRVLLLDDPLRNVDAKLRYEMRLQLPQLLRQTGAAVIYVTQDYREAMALGDRVAVLMGGRIVQAGRPEEVYDAPSTVPVARLFGDPPMNLLPVRPSPERNGVRIDAAGLSFHFQGEAGSSDALLGVRPEDVQIGDAGPGAAAEVIAVTPLHERQVVLLRVGNTELVASIVGSPPQAGATVRIRVPPHRALLFDAASGARLAATATAPEAVA